MYVIATERRLIMKDNTLDEFKPLEPDIFEPIDLSKTDIFEPIDFSNIDLSNEFEPVAFSIEDYDPEELDKLIDKLNDELETALEKAERQLFND